MKRWLIRAGVSAVVLAILLWIVPIGTVADALRRVSVWTWSASVAIFFVGHYLNALKLRLLLGGDERTLRAACVRAQYAGLVANLGLPGLAGGDLVRAAYLAPITGLKRIAVASVVDRVIDTLTVVLLVAVALPMAGVPPGIAGVVRETVLWLAAGAAVAVTAVIVAMRVRRMTASFDQVANAWAALAERKAALLGAVGISLAVQSAFVLTNVWLAREVGVTSALSEWFVAWPLSKLVAVLPISLGGIGVREAVLVSLLTPYGASRAGVLASGILWQSVFIITALAGFAVTQLRLRAASVPAPSAPSAKKI